jgi:hypothetical protein
MSKTLITVVVMAGLATSTVHATPPTHKKPPTRRPTTTTARLLLPAPRPVKLLPAPRPTIRHVRMPWGNESFHPVRGRWVPTRSLEREAVQMPWGKEIFNPRTGRWQTLK